MSFLVAAALAVGFLVAGPIVAHFLRKGQLPARAFPPTRWLLNSAPTEQSQRRLRDTQLLVVRALCVLCLAVLGATPFVRCERLAVTRQAGASLALAIVLDDSLSMRAQRESGPSRWTMAQAGALELLDGLRSGDRVSLVLAGKPARLLLAPTGSLAMARHLLSELHVTDRETDLDGALALAESSLDGAPQADQRLAVLSDFAVAAAPRTRRALWAPLPNLRFTFENCGVVRAERSAEQIQAVVACTSARAAAGRTLGVTTPRAANTLMAERRTSAQHAQKLADQAGTQSITLPSDGAASDLVLSGSDDLEADDWAAVAPESARSVVGVISARQKESSGSRTPALDQGLRALGLTTRPLADLPDDASELARYAALFVDNPVGFAPELRAALTSWLERGGVACAFIGDNGDRGQLGAGLDPFVEGRAPWSAAAPPELDVEAAPGAAAATLADKVGFLGVEGRSLKDLAARGRARLDGRLLPKSEVLLSWRDGVPWLVRREIGKGVAISVGLPSSPDQSDLALRPGFLALLDFAMAQLSTQLRAGYSAVGSAWAFENEPIRIVEPDGSSVAASAFEGPSRVFHPAKAGRYALTDGDSGAPVVEQIVHLTSEEVVTQSQPVELPTVPEKRGNAAASLDASPYVVWALAGLLAVELILRIRRSWGRPKLAGQRGDLSDAAW